MIEKMKSPHVVIDGPESGKSALFGMRTTQALNIYSDNDSRKFIDTSGLADTSHRNKAIEAIDQAFEIGGSYTFIFVISLESDKIGPENLATINLILKATRLKSNQFSVILNNVSASLMKKFNVHQEEREKFFVRINEALIAKTVFIHYWQKESDLNGKDDQMLKINEDFRNFLKACPSVPIKNPVEIGKIDDDEWNKEVELISTIADNAQEALNSGSRMSRIMATNILEGIVRSQERLMFCPQCALSNGTFHKIQDFPFASHIRFNNFCGSCRNVVIGKGVEHCPSCELKVCSSCLIDFKFDKLEVRKKPDEYSSYAIVQLQKESQIELFKRKNSDPSTVFDLELTEKNIDDKEVVILSQDKSWTNLKKLDLSRNSIKADGAAALSQNKTWKNLTTLNLSLNSIGPKGAMALSQSETWTNLEILDLSWNFINVKGVIDLSLNKCWKNLTTLSLRYNSISDEGAQALSQNKIWTSLKVLDLEANLIEVEGAIALSQNKSWTKLITLNLERNSIQAKGAIALSQNMFWTNLKRLYLGRTWIGDEGAMAIRTRWPGVELEI